MAFKRILLALECSKKEEKLVNEAFRVAAELDAELTAVHVNDPEAGKSHMMMDSLPLTTEDDVRNRIRQFGHADQADKIDVRILTGKSYPDEIAKAASGFDLLVVGHRHKNRFLARIIDSVDEHVADQVKIPLLVIPMR